MPLQPRIDPECLKLRIADRQKEIPPPDNPDGSFNLDGYRYKPGEYDRFTSWYTFAKDSERKIRPSCFIPYMNERIRFLDVGALCGSWTLPGLKMGAEVISIEPDMNFLKILENNVYLNGFTKWKGINCAVYDQDAIADFYDMKGVPITRLDSLGLGKIDYIKIDVEGAELEALRGARELISKSQPYLFIECHDGTILDMIYEELPGYLLMVIPWVPHILARPLNKPTIN